MSQRPVLCEDPENPHALNWLTEDFAYCPGCDLLYTRQPGVLVWVYDPWARRLADAVMEGQTRELAHELGIPPDKIAVALPEDGTR